MSWSVSTLGAELYATILARGLQGDNTPLEGFPPADTPNRAAFVADRAIAYRKSLGEQLLATFTAAQDHLQGAIPRSLLRSRSDAFSF